MADVTVKRQYCSAGSHRTVEGHHIIQLFVPHVPNDLHALTDQSLLHDDLDLQQLLQPPAPALQG